MQITAQNIDLANGNEENVSFEEQKQYWLAIHITYNSRKLKIL